MLGILLSLVSEPIEYSHETDGYIFISAAMYFLILCSISSHRRYHKLFVVETVGPTDLRIVVC